MTKTEYLYGDHKPEPVSEEFIEKRITLLRKNLDELLNEDWRSRDTARVYAVVKAINFWRKINET